MEQTLGRALQAQRKTRGLTIQALAAQAGVHRTTVSRWERGEATPFAYELTRVLEILDISPTERQSYYRNVEAPRAIQIARTNTNANMPVSLGELLSVLRQRAGVSQRQVARIVGVTQNLVFKWEKDECWPNNENLHTFCFAIGASQDELVFLTTRAWNQVEPLPQNREALDDFIQSGQDDLDTAWAGVYLAVVARYQSLYRAGKIGEIEALSVHALYAVYLAWRLQRFEDAKRIVAPIIASLGRSQGQLTLAQQRAITCQVSYDDAFGNERRNVPRNYGSKKLWEGNLALLDSLGHRYSAGAKPGYHCLLAQNWEKIGNMVAAEANYKHNITSASSKRMTQRRSWAYVEFLCRQGRFRDALPFLIPHSALPHGTPPLVFIKHWCNHAEVFAGLGDYAVAEGYLTQAVTYAHQHSEPSLSEHEFSRIGSLIK
ncbi:helix-turn-helix transcriptional regulator [Armatimonas sp.]|uniref:helix-turn-helix transcriptional regulator n=1 Tax=Armatimonas sp. TaxID=1872638 RepID=UPI00286C78BA|nr:helix-turn-helix transcriptional regulator [Armatimonas sp.]